MNKLVAKYVVKITVRIKATLSDSLSHPEAFSPRALHQRRHMSNKRELNVPEAPDMTRTCDKLITNQLLYQLSYRGEEKGV
jgi:hypothetical protein